MNFNEFVDLFDKMLEEISSINELLKLFEKMTSNELTVSNIDFTPFTIDWSSFDLVGGMNEFIQALSVNEFYKIIDQFLYDGIRYIYGIPFTEDHPAEFFKYQGNFLEKIPSNNISWIYYGQKMKLLDTYNWQDFPLLRIPGGMFRGIKHEYLFKINIQDLESTLFPFLKYLEYLGTDDGDEFFFSIEKRTSDIDHIKQFIDEIESPGITRADFQAHYYQYNWILKHVLDLPIILQFYVEKSLDDRALQI